MALHLPPFIGSTSKPTLGFFLGSETSAAPFNRLYSCVNRSWGLFERPADISAAYGGGKQIGVGGYQPTEKEQIAAIEATKAKLDSFRKAAGTKPLVKQGPHFIPRRYIILLMNNFLLPAFVVIWYAGGGSPDKEREYAFEIDEALEEARAAMAKGYCSDAIDALSKVEPFLSYGENKKVRQFLNYLYC